jgi:hypothetical protein
MGKNTVRMTVGAFALAAMWNLAALTGAQAQNSQSSIMKQCGDKWSAAKAANQVPAGTTWPKFLGQCRTEMAQPAAATAPAPAPAPAPAVVAPKPAPVAPTVAPKPATTATAPATGGMAGQQKRITQCGAEWRANKATLSKQYASWPKYWSACDARLKAAGQ